MRDQQRENQEYDRKYFIERQVKKKETNHSGVRKINGDATDLDSCPGQRNQDAQQDRRDADHVHKDIKRMLVRRGIARQHLHKRSVTAHLPLPCLRAMDYRDYCVLILAEYVRSSVKPAKVESSLRTFISAGRIA